jgi:hypothetical protein
MRTRMIALFHRVCDHLGLPRLVSGGKTQKAKKDTHESCQCALCQCWFRPAGKEALCLECESIDPRKGTFEP